MIYTPNKPSPPPVAFSCGLYHSTREHTRALCLLLLFLCLLPSSPLPLIIIVKVATPSTVGSPLQHYLEAQAFLFHFPLIQLPPMGLVRWLSGERWLQCKPGIPAVQGRADRELVLPTTLVSNPHVCSTEVCPYHVCMSRGGLSHTRLCFHGNNNNNRSNVLSYGVYILFLYV